MSRVETCPGPGDECPDPFARTAADPGAPQTTSVGEWTHGITGAAQVEALGLARLAMESIIDGLAFGVFVLDAAGTVLHCNAVASEIAAAGDGIEVGPCGFRLSSSGARRRYQAALATLTGESDADTDMPLPCVINMLRPSGRRPYTLWIHPLPSTSRLPVPRQPVAAVLVSDPDRIARPQPQILARALGVTPREAELALDLAAGYRLSEAAERLGVTPATARTYLKLIFRKTRVTHQGELVRLVLCTSMALPGTSAQE